MSGRTDKVMTPEEVVGQLRSGMTLGIGGWGSRRKPMALVRALLRSEITDLTVISYGGPDVGLLAAAGRIRRLVAPFATLDSIPLEPHFRAARERAAFTLTELDEAMFMWGLHAAANRLPFLPVRAGLGSDVMRVNPELRTVTSPTTTARSSSPSRPCAWTPPWSTSTAPTASATPSTWARTRTSTTCSARPPTPPTSPASSSSRPPSWRSPAPRSPSSSAGTP